MPKRRHTEEQIITILREGDAGAPLGELCRRHGISSTTYHRWKAQYGGLRAGPSRRRVLQVRPCPPWAPLRLGRVAPLQPRSWGGLSSRLGRRRGRFLLAPEPSHRRGLRRTHGRASACTSLTVFRPCKNDRRYYEVDSAQTNHRYFSIHTYAAATKKILNQNKARIGLSNQRECLSWGSSVGFAKRRSW